jgi:Sugar (and other) transporter
MEVKLYTIVINFFSSKGFRSTLLVTYIPAFLLVFYFWLTPESIRWLLARGRRQEAINVLKTISKINGKVIAEVDLKKLPIRDERAPTSYSLKRVLESNILLTRFIISSISWTTCVFLFYGLILNSVSLSQNSYLDFILTSLVEIPAYLVSSIILDKIGRRATQSGSYFLAAFACLAFVFIPTGEYERIQKDL